MSFIKSALSAVLSIRKTKKCTWNKRQHPLNSGHRAFLISSILLSSILLSGSVTASDTLLDAYISEHLPEASALNCREPTIHPSSFIHSCSFTSQQWPAGSETIEGKEWTHNITIAIPKDLHNIPETALYFSDGGDNERPGDYLKQFLLLARTSNSPVNQERTFSPNAIMDLLVQFTNTVIIYQQQVPNQPYTFIDDPRHPLTEDKLLAESLSRAASAKEIKEMSPENTLLFPMAHANVAGVYGAIDFVNQMLSSPLKHVIAGGASKRAWAIWLATAFDQGNDKKARQLISAVVPVAMIQNFPETLIAIRKSYCHFPKPLAPFTDRHIFQDLLSPYDNRYNILFREIDPYTFLKNERFDKVHTLVIQPSSDSYFIPDATRYYYPQLKGDKHLLVIPNTGHGGSLPAINYLYATLTHIMALVHGKPIPAYQEDFDSYSGILSLHTDTKPNQVYVWSANNPSARDFRQEAAEFTRHEILPIMEINGTYTYEWQPEDSKGWNAFFIEMYFSAEEQSHAKPFVFSSQVYITPNRYATCR